MAGKDERLKEITERLEQGVQELFTSERYTEYLKTMSQFHNYSFNNTMLIALQKPDASLVAGYQAWQNKFGRHVKRGEKGIQIISPAPVREKHEVEKIDPVTNEPVLRADGQPETEEIVTVIPRFRVTTVFDISQTDGQPLPDIYNGDLTASVENYEIFMEAIRRASSVPIRFDEIEGETHGYYSNVIKEIVIQEGMSQSQTMKTAIHEVAHATLHDRDFMQEAGIQKDQMTKEVEAESVAFAVCQYFGLDTSDYSFPYIAGWSSDKEMNELRTSMDTIRKTAGELIETIGTEFRELYEQREAENTVSQEQLFMDSQENEFAIYQITDTSRNRRDLFSGTHFLTMYKREVDSLGYEMIYHRGLNTEKPETLDDIWLEFNTDHPEGYQGRSLSISDIVVMKQDGDLRAYFTDDIGFKELPYFVQDREKLLQVKSMIQDQGIVTESTTGIYVDQHDGPWKTLDMQELNGQKFYLMEHETFGSVVAGVIVDGNRELVAQDIEWEELTGRAFDDTGVIMAIREYLEQKDVPIIDPMLEFDMDQPELLVYRHDYEYAKEHGELDLHRQSIEKNIQCKDAIEKSVSANFDGMRLHDWVLDSVVERFGMERVGYVLASTIALKDYDGRFSASNKAWAKEQNTVVDHDLLENDRRLQFMVDSHPAVLDGVVNIYRDKVAELEKTVEQDVKLTAEDITNIKFQNREYFEVMRTTEYTFSCEVNGVPDTLRMTVTQHDEDEGFSIHTEKDDIWDKMDRRELEKLEFTLEREAAFGRYEKEIQEAATYDELMDVQWGIQETENLNLSRDQLDQIYEMIDEKRHVLAASEKQDKEEAIYIPEAKKYLHLQTTDSGYDYTFFDAEYKELDGGVYDDADVPFAEVLAELLQEEGVTSTGQYEEVDVEELYEKVERAEYFPEKTFQALSEEMSGDATEIAFTSGSGYITVEKYDDGYDYTVFDNDFKEIGGNTFLEPEATMQDVVCWIFRDERCGELESKPISHEELKESVLKAAYERLANGEITPTSQVSMREKSLNGMSRHDVEATVLDFAQSKIDASGKAEEIKVLAARICGSRAKEGLYKDDDDLDVVVSYTGDITERDFFYLLHENGMSIAGMPLNATPISEEETGSLKEYMAQSEKMLNSIKEEKADRVDKQEVAEEPSISFYVAECMEFPVLGEYHDEISTIEEAVKFYESIPADRMHGVKGIGFDLQDGSFFDGEFPLMEAGVIDLDAINHVEHYKNSPLVQQAIADLSKAMQITFRQSPEMAKESNVPAAEQTTDPIVVPKEPEKAQEKEKTVQTEQRGGKRESVLKALRERQNKLKEQEKTGEKQKDKSKDHKKGDIDL